MLNAVFVLISKTSHFGPYFCMDFFLSYHVNYTLLSMTKHFKCTLYRTYVPTWHRTQSNSVRKTNLLMPFRETIAVCFETHAKHINAL